MTITEQIITIALCVVGTMTTRFLPFLIFRSDKPAPKYIQYLGKALPAAIFGMLVVYCLKNVNLTAWSFGIPEFVSLIIVITLHLWKRKMLLSITGKKNAAFHHGRHGMLYAACAVGVLKNDKI